MPPVNYHALIREVPDFPKPGILFYDITTLLKRPDALKAAIDQLAAYYQDIQVDLVAGVENVLNSPTLGYGREFFVGGGVFFTDQDLRALLVGGGGAAAGAAAGSLK